MADISRSIRQAARSIRALSKAAVFVLKLFPMIPSRPVDWITPRPVVEKVRYPSATGEAEGDLYKPAGAGPFPGILVCLGVVPFGVEHPQVPVLGMQSWPGGEQSAAHRSMSPALSHSRLSLRSAEHVRPARVHVVSRESTHAASVVPSWQMTSPQWAVQLSSLVA